MSDGAPQLSLVIPVYRTESGIQALIDSISEVQPLMPGELEVVFVVDGSPDRSYELLAQALPTMPFRSVLVELSRNFGAFAAVRQGLLTASGDYFAVMAADLQEPPELVVEFFDRLVSGEGDVVLGERITRSDPRTTRATSNLYWRSYRRLVRVKCHRAGSMFSAATSRCETRCSRCESLTRRSSVS